MSQSNAQVGYALYFIDVLACLLFCVTLALVTARFGRETSIALDLPELAREASTGAELSAPAIALRPAGAGESGEWSIFYESEPVTLEELGARLRSSPPPSVIVRSESSALSRVIAVAHDAGVLDIQLAYELQRGEGAER